MIGVEQMKKVLKKQIAIQIVALLPVDRREAASVLGIVEDLLDYRHESSDFEDCSLSTSSNCEASWRGTQEKSPT